MDMNQLLYNHQLAKMQASEVPAGNDHAGLNALVDHHAGQITAWRRTNGLPEAGWPHDERHAQGSME